MDTPDFTTFLYCDAQSSLVERMHSAGIQAQCVSSVKALISSAVPVPGVTLVVDGDFNDFDIKYIRHSFRTRFPHKILAVVLWGQEDHPQKEAAHGVLSARHSDQVLREILPWVLDLAWAKAHLMVLEKSRPRMDPAPVLDSVVHNLNNVLGVLMGYLDILGMKALDESQTRALAAMKEATTHMGGVFKNLATLMPSREFPLRPVALELIVQGGLAYARHMGALGVDALKGVKLHYACPESTQVATHGPTFIEALGHIVKNAYESYPKETKDDQRIIDINIDVLDQDIGKELRIEVKDAGPGLDVRVWEKAHEAFVTTKLGRKGLGFPLARQAMRALGGQLLIQNNDDPGLRVILSQPFMPT